MTADAEMGAIVDALGLPSDARVDARVPKKLLLEQGAPTQSDRRAIQDGIDELHWFAACKPATIGVPSFSDDTREYLEIAVVGCALRTDAKGNPAKAARLVELIHRAIPYPVLLVTADESDIAISTAHKRRAQNDAARTVIERVVSEAALRPVTASGIEATFLQSLALSRQPRADLYALYGGWQARIEELGAARLTGAFRSTDDAEAIARRRAALATHARLAKEIETLRGKAKREKQLSRRVDLNMTIQRLAAELATSLESL
jgi:hypothetical protein